MIGRSRLWSRPIARPDRLERGAGEESGVAGGSSWRDALTADARFAFRQFRRRWGTTLTMLTILSLGMSISTLLFSVVYSFAVQPPPAVPREDNLVRIRGSQAGEYAARRTRAFSSEEFEEYRRLSEYFSAVTGWANAEVNLDVAGGRELGALTAEAIFVTENYFAVLGVRPIVGAGLPTFEAGDPTSARVAVIGHVAWDQLFGRSPGVVGRTLFVNGVPITIVGVAPPRFMGMGGGNPLQLWLPLSSRHAVMSNSSAESLDLSAAARLRPGATPGEVTAAVRVIAARATAETRRPNAEELREPSTEVVPLLAGNGDPQFEEDVVRLTLSLGLVGLLILLVTCTNV
ncbi:MAG TPA: ABC transporter permease, partial [Longimicrobiaceae bacterium]|nr:ABC transporter permease [Longimicrobiaceae bacterium]